MKGSLGLSECSWFPACEETAGEGPTLCRLFLPGGFSPSLSLVKLKDLTLTCWSVLFPWCSVDNLRHLRRACWTLSTVGRTQSSADCCPACSGALGPNSFTVLTCEILWLGSNYQSGQTLSNKARLHSSTRARLRSATSFSHAIQAKIFCSSPPWC